MLSQLPSFESVFETVLAGHPAHEIVPALRVLPDQDQQAVLCTVCAIRDEIARNGLEHGDEVERLLESECPFFVAGVATCLLDDQAWRP